MSLFVGRSSYPAPFGASFSASGLKGIVAILKTILLRNGSTLVDRAGNTIVSR